MSDKIIKSQFVTTSATSIDHRCELDPAARARREAISRYMDSNEKTPTPKAPYGLTFESDQSLKQSDQFLRLQAHLDMLETIERAGESFRDNRFLGNKRTDSYAEENKVNKLQFKTVAEVEPCAIYMALGDRSDIVRIDHYLDLTARSLRRSKHVDMPEQLRDDLEAWCKESLRKHFEEKK